MFPAALFHININSKWKCGWNKVLVIKHWIILDQNASGASHQSCLFEFVIHIWIQILAQYFKRNLQIPPERVFFSPLVLYVLQLLL